MFPGICWLIPLKFYWVFVKYEKRCWKRSGRMVGKIFGRRIRCEFLGVQCVWVIFLLKTSWYCKKCTFNDDPNQSPSGKSLKMTIESFHGFGVKPTLWLYLLITSQFCCIFRFFVFLCRSINSPSGELGLGRLGNQLAGREGTKESGHHCLVFELASGYPSRYTWLGNNGNTY